MDVQIEENPDLTTCDKEPIHLPGSIQPHGILLVLDPNKLTVLQASSNADTAFGSTAEDLLGRRLEDLIGPESAAMVAEHAGDLGALDGNPSFIATLPIREYQFDLVAHRYDGVLLLELEAASAPGGLTSRTLYALVRAFVGRLRGMSNVEDLARLAAEEARRITGFDRVLTYRFDDEWNGVVIAEVRDELLPSYLGLRFPASDIPAPARRLYSINPFRLIADAGYSPVPLIPFNNPKTGNPLDLTFSHLRSVSPVHVEYLRNMGIVASMSISIFQGDRLWGLISCHHATARTLPYEVRTACEFLGQVVSVQLEEKLRNAEAAERIQLRTIQSDLLEAMSAEDDFLDGLIRKQADLLEFAQAGGAAIAFDDRITLLGATPTEEHVRHIIDYLAGHTGREVFATDCLVDVLPEAEKYKDRASGLLAIAISKVNDSFILWFRPEVVRTVSWGGDPRKPVDSDLQSVRLHPRKSFEAWKETVRNRSLPWRASDMEAAVELRNGVVGIVLRKAEELAALSAELQQSNKELEAFSYSVSHDLRAPFRHIVGYSELLREQVAPTLEEHHQRWVDTIIASAHHAGKLVDNLLSFSQMGRVSLTLQPIDMNLLIAEVVNEAASEQSDRCKISWRIAKKMPTVEGDPNMLRQVLRNLVSNAIKYSRPKPDPEIAIACETSDEEHVFSIRDNGVGFDMRYVDKLFGVFQRLHRMDEFEGTGIGLANVRRIIARHGGRTWAEGVIDEGATFYFSLPLEARNG